VYAHKVTAISYSRSNHITMPLDSSRRALKSSPLTIQRACTDIVLALSILSKYADGGVYGEQVRLKSVLINSTHSNQVKSDAGLMRFRFLT
jgi:hypothetical protein